MTIIIDENVIQSVHNFMNHIAIGICITAAIFTSAIVLMIIHYKRDLMKWEMEQNLKQNSNRKVTK